MGIRRRVSNKTLRAWKRPERMLEKRKENVIKHRALKRKTPRKKRGDTL